jgi:hypothetical protein
MVCIHFEACSIHLEQEHLLSILILLQRIREFIIFSVKLAVGCTLSMRHLEALYTVSQAFHIKCFQTALKKVGAFLNLPNPSSHTRPWVYSASNRNEYQKH